MEKEKLSLKESYDKFREITFSVLLELEKDTNNKKLFDSTFKELETLANDVKDIKNTAGRIREIREEVEGCCLSIQQCKLPKIKLTSADKDAINSEVSTIDKLMSELDELGF